MNRALGDLKRSNLKSNQKSVSELSLLLKMGNTQLEDIFRSILREDNRPIEPLHYITKRNEAHHSDFLEPEVNIAEQRNHFPSYPKTRFRPFEPSTPIVQVP